MENVMQHCKLKFKWPIMNTASKKNNINTNRKNGRENLNGKNCRTKQIEHLDASLHWFSNTYNGQHNGTSRGVARALKVICTNSRITASKAIKMANLLGISARCRTSRIGTSQWAGCNLKWPFWCCPLRHTRHHGGHHGHIIARAKISW